MKRQRLLFVCGLTVQLLAITVLPLTILLVFIAFGSIALHQQDMRALVGEWDERAVQSAASAIASELHHRAASISSLTALVELSKDTSSISATEELATDFDGGLAYLHQNGEVLVSSGSSELWNAATRNGVALASLSDQEPAFSPWQ